MWCITHIWFGQRWEARRWANNWIKRAATRYVGYCGVFFSSVIRGYVVAAYQFTGNNAYQKSIVITGDNLIGTSETSKLTCRSTSCLQQEFKTAWGYWGIELQARQHSLISFTLVPTNNRALLSCASQCKLAVYLGEKHLLICGTTCPSLFYRHTLPPVTSDGSMCLLSKQNLLYSCHLFPFNTMQTNVITYLLTFGLVKTKGWRWWNWN